MEDNMIIDEIKKERMKARKLHNQSTSKLLSIILGHADNTRDYSDDAMIKTIKDLIDGNLVIIQNKPAGSFEVQTACHENAILKSFLPQSLTGLELREKVESIIKEKHVTSIKGMGQIIGELKKTGKLVDGKEVRGYLEDFLR